MNNEMFPGRVRGCRWGRQVVMDFASHGELLKLCIVDRKELVWAINREERKLTFFGKVPGTKLEKRRNFGMQNNK